MYLAMNRKEIDDEEKCSVRNRSMKKVSAE
jgi:hypothetical protein